MTLSHWLTAYQSQINQSINDFFIERYPQGLTGVERIYAEAIRHAVEGGGKRLRPILALLSYEYHAQRSCPRQIVDGLIGIEFMHCFTLVHDDLPCMDNDILRRGKPTVWYEYGETMAVLVGDTLQTLAIDRLATLGDIRVIQEIVQALGDQGVARGQVLDTLDDQSDYTLEELMRVHDEKTGVLIAASLVIGAMLAQAHEEEIERMRRLGMLLGRAFQVRDDILDVEGDPSILGKTIGKDTRDKKGLIALIGLSATRELLEGLSSDIETLLVGIHDEKLHDVAEWVVRREG